MLGKIIGRVRLRELPIIQCKRCKSVNIVITVSVRKSKVYIVVECNTCGAKREIDVSDIVEAVSLLKMKEEYEKSKPK